jgi:hypothetical protein
MTTKNIKLQPNTLWETVMQLSSNGLARSQQLYKISNMIKLWSQDESTYVFPQKRIPNVRKFRVQALSNYHPIFEEAGIRKREFAPVIDCENYINKSQNRYIKHQLTRLNRNRGNPVVF